MQASSKPLCIFAHRGFHLECPENTVAAFKAALEIGAHGIELDVRLSRDGVPVVYHDPTLKHALVDRRLKIGELTASELEAIGRSAFGEPIPSLKRVLDETIKQFEWINVELKDQGSRIQNTKMLKAVQDIIAEYAHGKFIITSFHPFLIRAMKQWRRDLYTGFLLQPLIITAPMWKFWLNFSQADFYHPRYDWYFNWGSASMPKPVSIWTLDDPARYHAISESVSPVFGIITNRPDLWLK